MPNDLNARFFEACRKHKPEWRPEDTWTPGTFVIFPQGVFKGAPSIKLDFSDDRASAEALVLFVQELGRLGYLNIQFNDWGAPAANRIMLMATRTDDDQIHREGPTIIAAVARALMQAWEDSKP